MKIQVDQWKQLIVQSRIDCGLLDHDALLSILNDDDAKTCNNVSIFCIENDDSSCDYSKIDHNNLLEKIESILHRHLNTCLNDTISVHARRRSFIALQNILRIIHHRVSLVKKNNQSISSKPPNDNNVPNQSQDHLNVIIAPTDNEVHDDQTDTIVMNDDDNDIVMDEDDDIQEDHLDEPPPMKRQRFEIDSTKAQVIAEQFNDVPTYEQLRKNVDGTQCSTTQQVFNPVVSVNSSTIQSTGVSLDTRSLYAAVNQPNQRVVQAGFYSYVPYFNGLPGNYASLYNSGDILRQTTVNSVSVLALHDHKPTKACTVQARPDTQVTFQIYTYPPVSYKHMHHHLHNRFLDWDPFWINLHVGNMGITTSPLSHVHPPTHLIQSATQIYYTNPKLRFYNLSWGTKRLAIPWKSQEVSVLLRMLPMHEHSRTNKRSDYHLWPKGTFIQINDVPISIEQRKQSNHNLNEWTKMCKELNLVEYITDPALLNKIDIFCHEQLPYVYSISVCQYRSVDEVLRSFLPDIYNVQKCFDECKKQAIEFARSLISIDIDSDDEGTNKEELGKFVVSLNCPISKSIMEIPVRGKNCIHRQCFDLRNYLCINECVSGNRWRCACCDLFVSLRDIKICSLTQQFLQDYRHSITWNRHRVEFCSDGSYHLLETQSNRRQKISVPSWVAVKLEAMTASTDRIIELE